MSATDSEKNVHLGFVTVIEHPRFGMVGGFLVLNLIGRPIEFHCTSPIKPNRAQEILYGNTLKPYLFGEQIAQVLLRRAKSEIVVLMTDQPAVLAVQDMCDMPVLYVPTLLPEELSTEAVGETTTETAVEDSDSETETIPSFARHIHQPVQPRYNVAPLCSMPGLSVLRWKKQHVADSVIWIPDDRTISVGEIANQLNIWAKSIDYAEPFQRIRLALEEAQKAA